ncbi:MAG: nitrogenase [Cyanobacteria bacterium CRU_2_1]|nr:nitrogenase [Cyanobacteria bacterium RU_5_0]NJR58895.1 nitrogenase [Cyanobacteria bacterium CRU_2_1]
MNASDINTENLSLVSWVWIGQSTAKNELSTPLKPPVKPAIDLLLPIRNWLDTIEVKNANLARSLCKFIPAQCPFARDVKVFGRTLLCIPPMCKLNPVYDQIVALRFRALCYLADVCGEDITPYC